MFYLYCYDEISRGVPVDGEDWKRQVRRVKELLSGRDILKNFSKWLLIREMQERYAHQKYTFSKQRSLGSLGLLITKYTSRAPEGLTLQKQCKNFSSP